VDLGNGTHDIDVSVVLSSSDGVDEDLSNNQLSAQFVTLSGEQATLTLLTDNYPGETTWTVTDANGATVWSGGAYSTAQTEYVETTCLALGCYTLSVMDSYGDGMTYGGVTGHYELVDDVGTVLAQIVEGGDFGSQADHSFCLELVGIPGCMELDACNYDPNATDPAACIYPVEGFDCDGVSLCPLDLNSNGTIEVSDLLMILSDFGCTVDCVSDVDGDGAVTVSDVLIILSSFGDPCPVL
jgi:hypothetical protein